MSTSYITTHFSMNEFIKNNEEVPLSISNNITSLVLHILEPIRIAFDSPVIITSGYRNKEYNASVGGSPTSDHVFGRAADFFISGQSMYEVAEYIKEHLSYSQLIYYPVKRDGLERLHVSYVTGDNKLQCLTTSKIGEYSLGLIK